VASGYSLLQSWLQANGFSVVRESITREGIEVDVRASDGRCAKLIYERGTDPLLALETVHSFFDPTAQCTRVKPGTRSRRLRATSCPWSRGRPRGSSELRRTGEMSLSVTVLSTTTRGRFRSESALSSLCN
jgi:hypothetical protein